MTKKKSVLGLAPLAVRPKLSASGVLAVPGAAFGNAKDLTKGEKWTVGEWRKQTLVMDAGSSKTMFGNAKTVEIYQHGAGLFFDTLDHIMEIKHTHRDAETQMYVDEFTEYLLPSLAQMLMMGIERGGQSILEEIARPLYPPEVSMPERPKGLFGRLFGG